MPSDIERITRLIYRAWKKKLPAQGGGHPSEEKLACFLENRLSADESRLLKEHIIGCEYCSAAIQVGIKAQKEHSLALPPGLLEKGRQLLGLKSKGGVLELILAFKQGFWQVLQSNADVLLGQEFIPAPVLRSRKISDFKDTLTVLKDFDILRVEVKLRSKDKKRFNLAITAKDKTTQKPVQNLRVSLIREDVELESYSCDSGSVNFEDVMAGKYRIEIRLLEDTLAFIALEIKG